MRKSITPTFGVLTANPPDGWLDLENIAKVELSSEDPSHPFEDALKEGTAGGWKAAIPGAQLIRLTFDSPQAIHRLRVQFKEEQTERSQEFAIFVSSGKQPRTQVLRQQWSFSPSGSTSEKEDYPVDLQEVTTIDLEIDPGRHDRKVFATLQFLALA